MVRSAASLHASLDELARLEPAFARVIEEKGRPEPRQGDPGVETLLRTIVGQQVSVAAARSMWNKLAAKLGTPVDLDALLASSDEQLREAGLSRQKAGYARSLAGWCCRASSTSRSLPADDEEAIAELSRSRASAAGRRKSICCSRKGGPTPFPPATSRCRSSSAGCLGHAERPSEKQVREWAEAWRPHRGAAAVLAWHSYNNTGTAL